MKFALFKSQLSSDLTIFWMKFELLKSQLSSDLTIFWMKFGLLKITTKFRLDNFLDEV
jgi:hypothetical protein